MKSKNSKFYLYGVRVTEGGYFVDKLSSKGDLIETYIVKYDNYLNSYYCSCKSFKESLNYKSHLHCIIVERFINSGLPENSLYYLDLNKKVAEYSV